MTPLMVLLPAGLGIIVGYCARGVMDAFKNEKAAQKALEDWRRERFLQGRAYLVLRAAQERWGDDAHLH